MMKGAIIIYIGAIILLLMTIISCESSSKMKRNESVRKEILNREFANDEVKSIEIVEIEHPMLGGIIAVTKLNQFEQHKFLSDFERLEEEGIFKCKSRYVVRINFESDTLRLKVCGNKISNRMSDMYYTLPGKKSIIENYIRVANK